MRIEQKSKSGPKCFACFKQKQLNVISACAAAMFEPVSQLRDVRGTSAPGRRTLGAPFGNRNVAQYEYESLKMSIASDSYPVAKFYQEHHGSQKRAVTNFSDIFRWSCLQQSVPAYGLTHGCVTMLSDNQGQGCERV